MTRGRGWARGLRPAAAVLATALMLAGCSGGAGTSQGPTSTRTQGPPSSSADPTTQGATGAVSALACWGDSLTAGSGGDGVTYPDQLAELTGLPVFNGGVPGERSAAVAAREGGLPPATTVVGGSIPASGGVEVTFGGDVVIIRDEGTLDGTLAGVHGVLSKDQRTNFGKYTFTRDEAGDPVDVPDPQPFVTDISAQYRDAGVIIWAGHNDIRFGGSDEILANIAKMVDFVAEPSGGHYLVLGLTNGTSAAKGTEFYHEGAEVVNPALEQTYGPDHYLDVRRWLIDDGLDAAGITATDQDRQDIANDIPPTSLRDPRAVGHLNGEGYTVLAQYIQQFLTDQGWF